MRITFLGTSAGIPTPHRNVSATALIPDQSGEWILFDCGEGTQHNIMKSSLRLGRLGKIFITHMHGDHIYGLFGLMASRGMQSCGKKLTLYAPAGIVELIETVFRISDLKLSFDLDIVEIQSGDKFDFENYHIECVELSHSITSFGFVLTENDRPGKLDIEKALSLGVPNGALLGKLKRGEIITLQNGKTIDGKNLLGNTIPGKRVIIGGDNDRPELFMKYTEADLMIHEATYTQKDFDSLEKKYKHSTARQVAIVAEKMRVKRLILNHISPRYDNKERTNELLEEAKRYYTGTVQIANDFMQIDI